jgi:hypothetical protein
VGRRQRRQKTTTATTAAKKLWRAGGRRRYRLLLLAKFKKSTSVTIARQIFTWHHNKRVCTVYVEVNVEGERGSANDLIVEAKVEEKVKEQNSGT